MVVLLLVAAQLALYPDYTSCLTYEELWTDDNPIIPEDARSDGDVIVTQTQDEADNSM